MNKKMLIGICTILVILAIIVAAVVMSRTNNSANSNTTAVANETHNMESLENNENTNPIQTSDNSKILIAYFSLPESTDPNNMTKEGENSAIVVDGKVLGNNEYMATILQEKLNADIFRIEAKNEYDVSDHQKLIDYAREEQKNDTRPEIKNKITNFDDYDTIFIGYPIWWSSLPQILYTFLESYDFSGKNVYLFNSHGGSGLSGTVEIITDKLKGANVNQNAVSISRNNMETAPEKISSWLNELGF